MNRKLALVMGSLLLASTASANAPLPKNLKVIDPPVRFEGIDKDSPFVFYLRYIAGVAGYPRDPKYVEVKDSATIKLDGPYLFTVTLLALERKEFEKRAKEKPALGWLTDKTNGVLAAPLDHPSMTAPKQVKEIPLTTYRVTLKDGKLTAEKVIEKKNNASKPPAPTWAFGMVLSLALAWLGDLVCAA